MPWRIFAQMKKRQVIVLMVCGVVICSFIRITQRQKYSFTGPPKTREQLGEILFFEKKLSADNSVSCGSCHIPEFAFADTAALSRGVGGMLGKRNTPSCANMAERAHFFYDGRAATLEDQVRFPMEDKNEMAFTMAGAVKRLKEDKQYVAWFKAIFKSEPTEFFIKAAIASYERTLETSETPFDRFMDKQDGGFISASAVRGRELFLVKAKCFECHFSPDFTGDEFRNIGLFDGAQFNDSGRYVVTKDPADVGKFKVPGLRNVAVTAPYMHNGMFRTLREVIDFYDNPYKVVAHPVNMDTLLLQPLNLTAQEKDDLEAFLYTLTDDKYKNIVRSAKN